MEDVLGKQRQELQEARRAIERLGNPIIPEMLLYQFTVWTKLFESETQHAEGVIIDRFVLSNMVYTLARCEQEHIAIDLDLTRSLFLKPFGIDVLADTQTIYLDCPPEVAAVRIASRKDRNDFDTVLQSMAREIYKSELLHYNHRLVCIDASGNIEHTWEQVRNVLREVRRH